MADYKTLHGTNIEVVSSDPSNPVNGQVWYNTTSNVIKGFTSNPTGSWAAGGNMNTARRQAAGAGIQTSALVFGGYTTAKQDITESYNGSAWSEVADLNVDRSLLAGCGASNTAGLAFGGLSPATPPTVGLTELWNGTSWTEVADLNTARRSTYGTGTSTAALLAGGYVSGAMDETEIYNGTSWAETADLNTGRWVNAAAGISTSALAFGGQPGSGLTADTESWNGTSWTEVANLNVATSGHGGLGATNTAALSFGGDPGPGAGAATNEKWNGTSWAEVADLNTGRYSIKGAGTTTAGLAFAGYNTAASASTEEWNEPVEATVTFDASDV